MQSEKPQTTERKTNILNFTLASVTGQVGCFTFVIIIGAILGGIWLDNYFQTKPIFTLGLLIVSIPVSIAVMIIVVRYATSKFRIKPTDSIKDPKEAGIGKN